MDARVDMGDADLCRWFATILARELPAQAIEAYLAGAAAPFLDALAARCDIGPERTTLEAAIAGWPGLGDPAREMATEFASLFLLPGKAAPSPFASYFEEGTLYGAAHDRMRARLSAAGLAVAATDNGPADHVSIMLEYLAHLFETGAPGDQKRAFVKDEVQPLVTRMSARLQPQDAGDAFYPSALRLLGRYLHAI